MRMVRCDRRRTPLLDEISHRSPDGLSMACLNQGVLGCRRDGDDVVAVKQDRMPAATSADPKTPVIGGVQDTKVVVVVGLDDKKSISGRGQHGIHDPSMPRMASSIPAPVSSVTIRAGPANAASGSEAALASP